MARTNTARRVPYYRGEPYWDTETPVTADTNRLRFNYFEQAGKLQVSQLFRDKETGELRRGRTVVFDEEDLRLHPEARGLLMKVLNAWEEL